MIAARKTAGEKRSGTEFEAFVLNELCQFSGSRHPLHCDELGHLCRVPYRLRLQKAEDPDGRIGWATEKEEMSERMTIRAKQDVDF